MLKMTPIKKANETEEDFDSLDYNNQRNFLWCLADIARARENTQQYAFNNFPYSHTKLVDDLLLKGSGELTALALKLTEFGREIKLEELLKLT